MDIKTLRTQIDSIDAKMLELFSERMKVSEEVARIKQSSNMALTDEKREQEIINNAVSQTDNSLKGETTMFMRSLLSLSKAHQRKELLGSEPLLNPRKPKTGKLTVGYQGVPGAWGEKALMQYFSDADQKEHDSFEDVFAAVKNKEVDYGVVPIENSQTGAIGEVYDLLRKYGCYIVGQTWVEVKHCLMGTTDAKLQDVREVFSHPEGFKQCSDFLKGRAWDLTACRNTAMAAELVASRNETRAAAIGSPRAAELNGLQILAPDIMDRAENKTRFIVIADEPEFNEDCDTVSLVFITAHRSGALCEALFSFMSEEVNLSRIESRPVSGGKYCFFADLQGNIQNKAVASSINQALAASDYLEVLGCYSTK